MIHRISHRLIPAKDIRQKIRPFLNNVRATHTVNTTLTARYSTYVTTVMLITSPCN